MTSKNVKENKCYYRMTLCNRMADIKNKNKNKITSVGEYVKKLKTFHIAGGT